MTWLDAPSISYIDVSVGQRCSLLVIKEMPCGTTCLAFWLDKHVYFFIDVRTRGLANDLASSWRCNSRTAHRMAILEVRHRSEAFMAPLAPQGYVCFVPFASFIFLIFSFRRSSTVLFHVFFFPSPSPFLSFLWFAFFRVSIICATRKLGPPQSSSLLWPVCNNKGSALDVASLRQDGGPTAAPWWVVRRRKIGGMSRAVSL